MTKHDEITMGTFNGYLMNELRLAIAGAGHNLTSASEGAPWSQQQLSDYLAGKHKMSTDRLAEIVTFIGGDPTKVFKAAVEAWQQGDPLPPKRNRRKRGG